MPSFKYLACGFLFMVGNFGYADQITPCANLNCVREQIDSVDKKLVDLIGQRLAYVKQAGVIKKGKPVHDTGREKQILTKVRDQAKEAGYPEQPLLNIFKSILKEANIYEQQSQLK